MMKQITDLRDIKKIQIDILNEFDYFCKKNNLRYYLSGGTLLGAVRHKGYIPWDDDIDVMMPRPDYDKFLLSFNGQNDNYRVISREIDSKFPFTFGKMEDVRTRLIEDTLLKYNIGINIDIFPLDGLPQNYTKSKKFIKKILFLRKLYLIKSIKDKKKRKRFKKFILFILKLSLISIDINKILNKIISNSKKYNYDSSDYVGCVVWGYGIKERMDKKIFTSSIEIEFENNLYNAPVGYEIYLKNLYGDFMKLPSKEKRITHHSYKAYLKNED